jgi:hypothetical protein
MMRPSSLPHRKPATKGRREPAPPPPGPTPEQLEIKALREENERLRAAEADAGEGLAAAKEELDEVGKREAALADLLASAGCDTLSLNNLSWSTADAQQLLEEEAEHLAALQASLQPATRTRRCTPSRTTAGLACALHPCLRRL